MKPAFTVNKARAMAKAENLTRLMIIWQDSEGYINGVSYGKTKEICQQTGKLLDKYVDDMCEAL